MLIYEYKWKILCKITIKCNLQRPTKYILKQSEIIIKKKYKFNIENQFAWIKWQNMHKLFICKHNNYDKMLFSKVKQSKIIANKFVKNGILFIQMK